MVEVVIDFSSNILSATVETNEQIDSFVASITPNNYLSALDFLSDNNVLVLPDLVTELDYSVAEY